MNIQWSKLKYLVCQSHLVACCVKSRFGLLSRHQMKLVKKFKDPCKIQLL